MARWDVVVPRDLERGDARLLVHRRGVEFALTIAD